MNICPTWSCFNEYMYNLIFWLDNCGHHLLTHNNLIKWLNTSIIGSLMKNWITSYMDSSLIIKLHCHGILKWETKLLHKILDPHDFIGWMHSSMLCFSIKSYLHILFLTPPCNQVSTNKHTTSTNGSSINVKVCPISMWKANNVWFRISSFFFLMKHLKPLYQLNISRFRSQPPNESN